MAAAGDRPWALDEKPDLGFEFDALGYSLGGGTKTLAGHISPLAVEEVLAIEQWLDARKPHDAGADYVHGADADGRYLGLVPATQAVFVLQGPPPSGVGWRWDGAASAWVPCPDSPPERTADSPPDLATDRS